MLYVLLQIIFYSTGLYKEQQNLYFILLYLWLYQQIYHIKIFWIDHKKQKRDSRIEPKYNQKTTKNTYRIVLTKQP